MRGAGRPRGREARGARGERRGFKGPMCKLKFKMPGEFEFKGAECKMKSKTPGAAEGCESQRSQPG